MKNEYIPWGFTVITPDTDDEASLEQAEKEGWDNIIGEHPIVMLSTKKAHKIPLISINGVILSEREVIGLDLSVTQVTEQEEREVWPSSYNPADGWIGQIIGFIPERLSDKKRPVCPEHWLELAMNNTCGDISCRIFPN